MTLRAMHIVTFIHDIDTSKVYTSEQFDRQVEIAVAVFETYIRERLTEALFPMPAKDSCVNTVQLDPSICK